MHKKALDDLAVPGAPVVNAPSDPVPSVGIDLKELGSYVEMFEILHRV